MRRHDLIVALIAPPTINLVIVVCEAITADMDLFQNAPADDAKHHAVSVFVCGLDRSPLAHLPALARTGAQSSSALVCAFS